jgi:hypothetical protein
MRNMCYVGDPRAHSGRQDLPAGQVYQDGVALYRQPRMPGARRHHPADLGIGSQLGMPP